MTSETAGALLRRRLDEMSLSQADLARRIEMSADHVGRIVRDESGYSDRVARRLALVTGVPYETWVELRAGREDRREAPHAACADTTHAHTRATDRRRET